MLFFATLNYLIRFVKWHYYLHVLNVSIPLKASILIFFSGFSMTITPAKSGELIKPYLLQRYGLAVSRTAPVVAVERLTDLLGMGILVVIGSAAFVSGIIPALTLIALLLMLLIAFQYEPVSMKCLEIICRFPLMKRYRETLHSLYSSTRQLTASKPLGIGTGLSVISWFFESLGLYVALIGTGNHITVLDSVFIYAFSIISGFLAMLPGGLGATEGIMILLLAGQGIPAADATAATLLCRAATLWFAVAIGLASLVIHGKLYGHKRKNQPH
jgi:uncharacterized protein (TIRG00374 family)